MILPVAPVIPSGARCAFTAAGTMPAGPPRNPAEGQARPVVRHPASASRARAAQRAPTAVRREGWRPRTTADNAAADVSTAEAHAARRGLGVAAMVGRATGLAAAAAGFLGSPPGSFDDAAPARRAPLGMTGSGDTADDQACARADHADFHENSMRFISLCSFILSRVRKIPHFSSSSQPPLRILRWADFPGIRAKSGVRSVRERGSAGVGRFPKYRRASHRKVA